MLGAERERELRRLLSEQGSLRISVEAKRRESRKLKLGRLFNDALSKHAKHARVVFMDVNTPDNGHGDVRPPFLEILLKRLRASEGTLLNGRLRPPAYVVMTNTPGAALDP